MGRCIKEKDTEDAKFKIDILSYIVSYLDAVRANDYVDAHLKRCKSDPSHSDIFNCLLSLECSSQFKV